MIMRNTIQDELELAKSKMIGGNCIPGEYAG